MTTALIILSAYAVLATLLARYLWRKWNESVKAEMYQRACNIELSQTNDVLRRGTMAVKDEDWPSVIL